MCVNLQQYLEMITKCNLKSNVASQFNKLATIIHKGIEFYWQLESSNLEQSIYIFLNFFTNIEFVDNRGAINSSFTLLLLELEFIAFIPLMLYDHKLMAK